MPHRDLGEPPLELTSTDLDGPVHLHQAGDPDAATTLVLVHGLGASHLSWHPVVEPLARRHRLLVPDLPGFGHTDPVGRGTGVGANAALLARLVREAADGPVVLAGNSMGGMIAALVAHDHPDLVSRLVLVDPALPGAIAPRALRAMDPRLAATFALAAAPVAGSLVLRWRRTRSTAAQQVAELLDQICADPSAVPAETVAALTDLAAHRRGYAWSDGAFVDATRSVLRQLTVGRRSLSTALRRLRVPTLLLHGEADPLVHVSAARAAAARNPHIDLVTLPDVGHAPQLEAPARFVELVEGWLGDRDRGMV